MPTRLNVTKSSLQNYLLNRSFLVKKADSIHEVLEKFKCIQVDPINVVVRSHELALWNRVNNFRIRDLSMHLYHNRSLFEYWLQLFSVIPTQFYPYLSHRMKTGGRWQKEYFQKHHKEIRQTLEFVKENGVTLSKDLTHIPKVGSLLSWSDSSRTAVLEYLWDTGKIMIHHRERNQKFYDLTERLLPPEILKHNITADQSLEFFLESAFDYTGILRKPFANHLTHRLGYVDTFAVCDLWNQWLESGRIVELAVENVKTEYFILKRQMGELEALGKEKRHAGLNILPPLDPLIIDRRLVHDIFDFEYTWEAYTPPSKRKFGYYGMPLLYSGRLIGQIDARRDKKGKLKILRQVSLDKTSAFKKDLKVAISSLEKFADNGATRAISTAP